MCEAEIILECATQEWRKAKKPHRCTECGEIIKQGERYFYQSGIGDGQIFTTKYCALCNAVDCHLNREADYPRAWGCVVEDCAEELPPDEDGCYQTGRKAVEAFAKLKGIAPLSA